MRTFAVVRTSFWTGRTGRALRGHHIERELAMYLMTGPHSDLCGVYRLPCSMVAHDLGETEGKLRGAIAMLRQLDFCDYDPEGETWGVWRMPYYQLGDGCPTDKRLIGVRKQLARMTHPFARRVEAALVEAQSARNLDVVPPHPPVDLSRPPDQREEEQEGEGEEEEEKDVSEARVAKPLPSPSKGFDPLHAVGGLLPALPPASEFVQFLRATWPDIKRPEEKERLWRDACPAVDLLAAAKEAASWEGDSPVNRKTDHGAFLGRWLRREQQNARKNAKAPIQGAAASLPYYRDFPDE